MADSSKLKLLHVLDIMQKTDDIHPLTTSDIVRKLAGHGIIAERKSVARDLTFLEVAGYSIKRCDDHNKGYYMTDHLFEDYELKLLCDVVNAAPFLTMRDSRILTDKLRTLATPEGENLINATSFVDESIKTEDKTNKLKLDTLVRAIRSRSRVSFKYHSPGKSNIRVSRRGGGLYTVSPYYLLLNQNVYYLIGNPASNDHLTHFKIEMMANISILDEKIRDPRSISAHGDAFNLPAYVRHSINMWGGELVDIKLRCDNSIRDNIRMQFGKKLWITEEDDRSFTVRLKVTNSNGLYQWLAQYGQCTEVLSPDEVRARFVEYLSSIADKYR